MHKAVRDKTTNNIYCFTSNALRILYFVFLCLIFILFFLCIGKSGEKPSIGVAFDLRFWSSVLFTFFFFPLGKGQWKNSNASFLFSLRNPNNMQPFKCPIINGKNGNANYCNPSEQHLVEVMICTSMTMPAVTQAHIATLVTHTNPHQDTNITPHKPSHCLLVATTSHQQKLKCFTEELQHSAKHMNEGTVI